MKKKYRLDKDDVKFVLVLMFLASGFIFVVIYSHIPQHKELNLVVRAHKNNGTLEETIQMTATLEVRRRMFAGDQVEGFITLNGKEYPVQNYFATLNKPDQFNLVEWVSAKDISNKWRSKYYSVSDVWYEKKDPEKIERIFFDFDRTLEFVRGKLVLDQDEWNIYPEEEAS